MDLNAGFQAGSCAAHVANSVFDLPLSSEWPSTALAGDRRGDRRGTAPGRAEVSECADLALDRRAHSAGIWRISVFGDDTLPELSRLDAGAGWCGVVGARAPTEHQGRGLTCWLSSQAPPAGWARHLPGSLPHAATTFC